MRFASENSVIGCEFANLSAGYCSGDASQTSFLRSESHERKAPRVCPPTPNTASKRGGASPRIPPQMQAGSAFLFGAPETRRLSEILPLPHTEPTEAIF